MGEMGRMGEMGKFPTQNRVGEAYPQGLALRETNRTYVPNLINRVFLRKYFILPPAFDLLPPASCLLRDPQIFSKTRFLGLPA